MIIGIFIGIAISIVLYIIYDKALPFIIKKCLKLYEKVDEIDEVDETKKEQQRQKEEKIRKSFDELMNYDYETALGGGRDE